VENIVDRYIIEFGTKNCHSFSKVESIFKKGTSGRLIREIPLWMKVLLVEGGMLPFTLVDMDE